MKVKCLNCGKEFDKLPNQVKKFPNHYCNNSCQSELVYKNFINDWLKGKVNGVKSAGWQKQLSGHIRRYLLEINNKSCSECGWNKLHPDGKSPLHIDHIDSDATNNQFSNLRVLCPNCHSLTENFGSRNKNSTRYLKSTR